LEQPTILYLTLLGPNKRFRAHTYVAGLHGHFNRGRLSIEAFFQPIFFFYFESFLITFDWLKKHR